MSAGCVHRSTPKHTKAHQSTPKHTKAQARTQKHKQAHLRKAKETPFPFFVLCVSGYFFCLGFELFAVCIGNYRK